MSQSFLRNFVLSSEDDEKDEMNAELRENERGKKHLDVAESLIKTDKSTEHADDDDFYIPRKYSKYL